jgi:hypothetical protein
MKTAHIVRLNDKGVAVFMALIILFVITIAGISIILIAGKDKQSSADVSAIRTAVNAADAALSAYENQCHIQPAVIRGILNKYIEDKSYKWLLVSDSSSANSEKKVALGTYGLYYSAMISAYDKSNQVLQVTGIGYGRSDAKKSVNAIYKLTGLDTVPVSLPGNSRYGLYLAGNGKNFDKKMNVYGNVYVGQSFLINGSGQIHIYGSLKTGYNPLLQSDINGALIVDSAAYFGSKLNVKAAFTCNSEVGVEGAVSGTSTFNIGGNVWMNDTNVINSIVMSNKTIHHSGHVNMARVTNGVEDNKKVKITGIPDLVGLSNSNDSAWTFLKAAELIAMAKPGSADITAADLQTFYNNCPNANKYKGYAVLTAPYGYFSAKPGPGTFSGKIIILVNKGMQVNGDFPDMTSDSRILIYVYGNASITDFAGCYNSSFNGMIYAVDNPIIILGSSGKTFSINGAIHYASNNATWQLNSGITVLNLMYNDAIVSEFENIGLIRRPNVTAGSAAGGGTVILKDLKIKSERICVLY